MSFFNKATSVKEAFGIVSIGDGTILRADGTRFIFFKIDGTNLKVLSPENVYNKIANFSSLIQTSGQIEIYALDAKESFSANKEYLEQRRKEEKNSVIYKLLTQELNYVKELEASTSTAREFLLVLKIRSNLEISQIEAELARFTQLAAQSMITLRRLTKDDVKSLISVYFHADTTSADVLEDYEGQQFYGDVDFIELQNRLTNGEFSQKIVEFDLDKTNKKEGA